MSVTAIKSGARIATKINKAPGVSVPVTIASHSWNWTRISVARKTPVPPHRSPKAIRSLRVDRAPDDREERLLQGHGPDGGGQVFAQRDVHDLVDPRRFHDHVQGVPLFDALAEGGELLPMVAAVLDRDAQRAADLPLHPFRVRSRRTSHTARRANGSSPIVGSSRNRRGASVAKTVATIARCFCPPDKVTERRSATSSRPIFSSEASVRAFASSRGNPRARR